MPAHAKKRRNHGRHHHREASRENTPPNARQTPLFQSPTKDLRILYQMFKEHWEMKAAAAAWVATVTLTAMNVPVFATFLAARLVAWPLILMGGEIARRKRLGKHDEHCSYAFGFALAFW
jgi:hypothetical protein